MQRLQPLNPISRRRFSGAGRFALTLTGSGRTAPRSGQKLREEADELIGATSADEVVWESADLMCAGCFPLLVLFSAAPTRPKRTRALEGLGVTMIAHW